MSGFSKKTNLNSLRPLYIWIIGLSTVIFLSLVLPATYPASHNYSELWSFDMDEPHFMMPPLLELSRNQYPGFWTYGNFPAFAANILFAPFLYTLQKTNGQVDYFFLVLIYRFTQIGMALIAAFFLYRLSRLIHHQFTTVTAILLLFSSPILYTWTLFIHPDIFQVATIIASIYFLALYSQKQSYLYLLSSAILCGLATSSKYWGVWLIPTVPFLLFFHRYFSSRKLATSLFSTIVPTFLYILISFAIFVLLNRHFVTNPSLWATFQAYNQNNPHFKLSVNYHLLQQKISNITSPDFFGSSLIIIYLASLARDLVSFIRRKSITPNSIIHFTILVFFTYYFLLFNDPVNLPRGERYIMPFVFLMTIPTLSLIQDSFHHQHRWVKYLTIIAIPLLLVSQIFKLIAYPTNKLNLGQSDIFNLKQPASLTTTLNRFYQKESYGTFLVRSWIIKNVPDKSSIYVEAYMNIGNQWTNVAPPTENDDLPNITIFYDPGIKEENIEKYHPDYIFTKHESWIPSLIAHFPSYKVIDTIGQVSQNRVFILKK